MSYGISDLNSIEIINLLFKNHYIIDLYKNNKQITVLFGLNGSGKTTLLNLIYHILKQNYDEVKKIKFSEDDKKFAFTIGKISKMAKTVAIGQADQRPSQRCR